MEEEADRMNEHWQVIEKDSNQFDLEETTTQCHLSPSQRLQKLGC